jgi:predicted alpha-1,6-mannanase (GH76 family)
VLAANLQNNKYREYAKTVLEALQNKWYSRWWIGLIHQQPWHLPNPWNAYNTLEALIDYTQLTTDKSYFSTIDDVAGNFGLLKWTVAAGNDDAAWAGIALVKAYRLTKKGDYLSKAKEVFSQLITYWDEVCHGGVWWDLKRTYKNAITNELFLMLATILYQETKEQEYLEWALKEWNWFKASGLINNDHLINDGLKKENCKNNGQTTWAYNQGVILGGLTNLWLLEGDSAYIDRANQIATAVINSTSLTCNGILKEEAKRLDSDQEQFKGIFMRYLAYLASHEPKKNEEEKQKFIQFIWSNANHVWDKARNKENLINAYWVYDSGSNPQYDAIAQTSGLDLFNAAMAFS